MSVNKYKLNWIKHSFLVGAACVSMNVFAGEATVWSDSAGDVVTDGAGDCLHTIWWKKDGSCGNDDANSDTHKHAAIGAAAATEHTHDGGSQTHSHEKAEAASTSAPAVAPTTAPVTKAAPAIVPFTASSATAFKTSGSDLSDEGKTQVKAFADKIEGHSVTKIRVEGYTDSRGSVASNQALSERRVASVKDEMVKNGIDASIITVVGHGESNPIADNETSEGRAKNRRVVVSVE